MDNLKYYNESLAYDFNLFMPREKAQNTDNIIKMPRATVKKRKAVAKRAVNVSLAAVLISAFFLAAVCGNIFLRIKVNEVSSEINEVNKEIGLLDAEYTRLFVDMEKVISYNNLETAAAELGMKKMDKNQVVYIQVNNKNAARISSGEKVVSNE